MVAEQQACFSEFRFAPYTGLGSEWVQLRLEGSWSRALLGGCGKRHIASAQSVPSLATPQQCQECQIERAVPQAVKLEDLQCA